MVEEIIYTSAEKGLKQGSRGFCTVVSTTGMALNLAERLESMSGYRQAFPLHDPKASLNPVCWSHMTTRLAGRSLHVISRVADAGQDYTGRSNKLAHHLVIDNVASLISGPARMLAEPGVVTDRWDGTVRHVPPRDLRSASMPATIPLVAWKALTGDEGWAGAVAEQLLQSPAPVSIIFDPGTDTLTLVREVLDLIPAAQRWNVTFSTYFTRLLAGAECQLRFVLNDTPEATSLRNDARARVVNLTSPLPAATGGTLVAMARQGQLTPLEPAPPQAPTAARSRAAAEATTKESLSDTAPDIAVPKLKPGLSPLAATNKPQQPPEFESLSRSKKPLIIGISLTVIFCIAAVVGTMVWRPDTKDQFSELMSEAGADTVSASESETDAVLNQAMAAKKAKEDADRERLEQAADKKKASDAALLATQQEQIRAMEEKIAAEKSSNAKAAEESALALKAEGPFAFIKEKEDFRDKWRQFLFNLPKPGERYTGDWPHLRTNEEPISLSLCEGAAPLFAACPYQLELTQDPNMPDEWIVQAKQAGTTEKIAKYTIKNLGRDPTMVASPDRELQFNWLPNASREKLASELLRWWPLEIRIGERKIVLLQRVAETPTTNEGRPSWEGIIRSKPIPLISTDAIQSVGFKEGVNAIFAVEVAQPNLAPQRFNLPIQEELSIPPVSSSESQSPASEEESSPSRKTSEKFFKLVPPFEFFDRQPEVSDSLIGFGKFELSVSANATKGLELHPVISVVLRLPWKKNIEKLPDSSTLSGLRTIVKTPLALPDWNPVRAEAAVLNIQSEIAASRNDINNWYTQSMKPLPKKNNFESDAFTDLALNAVKAVNSVVPNCKREERDAQIALGKLNVNVLTIQAGGQQIIDNAKRRVAAATNALQIAETQYEPRIELFAKAMKKMSEEIRTTQNELLKDHQTISEHIAACLAAAPQIHVRCTLSARVEFEECDSGSHVNIYFLESTSPNWPADSIPPEAK